MMSPAEIIAWAKAQDASGKHDAMGLPFTSWLVARYEPDGRATRDDHGRQVLETQAEHAARVTEGMQTAVGQTMDLFA